MWGAVSIRHIVVATRLVKSRNLVVQLFSCSSCVRNNHDHTTLIDPENTSQVCNTRLLKVAIVGVPNAGKSTLINRLMEFEVCPVSRKAHTTRGSQKAIFLEENTQIVFADTPGVVNPKESKKFALPKDFVNAPQDSVRDADLIAVVHSIENKILKNKLDPKVISVLQKFPTKTAILIINKIDKISGKRKLLETVNYLSEGVIDGKPIPVIPKKKKEKVLNMDRIFQAAKLKLQNQLPRSKLESNEICNDDDNKQLRTDENGRAVRGWPNFRDVFMISALEGDGVEAVKNYFKENAVPSPWAFGSEILTDCPPADLCLKIVKSKMLEYLKDEIPYIIVPKLEYWDTNDQGVLRIVIGMETPNERINRMVIGHGGSSINAIKNETERILSELLRTQVDLFINVSLCPSKKPKY